MFQISQIEPTVQTLEQCLTESVHGIGIIRDYLENLGVERMDVNPIEHLWDWLGHAVHGRVRTKPHWLAFLYKCGSI